MPGTVHLGSTGGDVKRLQRVLARSMVTSPFGPITGVFDAALDAAVRSFQSAEGLVVDGIVGPVTWSHLPAYREASPRLAKWLDGAGRGLVATGARRLGHRPGLGRVHRAHRRDLRTDDRRHRCATCNR